MSSMLEVLHGRLVTSVETDSDGLLIRCGADCALRMSVVVRTAVQQLDPSNLVGRRILAAHVSDDCFSLELEGASLAVRIEDIEPGVVEAVVLTTPSLIVVWP